ncbi:MAG: (Fe-S)-binding protein [Planctomycetes bacterium]|nr:(Fe-S)-binding protein [Planctomycetota bacterium]
MTSTSRTPLTEEIARCAKCGKCRSVCPVFLETGTETMVARGRIALAEAIVNGEAHFTGRFEEYINTCLKCLRCESLCPSGVEYHTILDSIRRKMARRQGVAPLARMIFRLMLPHRWLFDLGLFGAAIGQRLIPLKRRGPMRHLPLFFMGRRWIPTLSRHTAIHMLNHTRRLRNPRMRVGFFVGCLINYVYPEIARSLIRVLNHFNVEVVVPRRQVCCGTPILSFGDEASARMLARRNLRAFDRNDLDYIVVACASGGRALKSEYPILLGDAWAPLRAKVLDISEFIDRFTDADMPKLTAKVTYHDPCHLNWGQGVAKEPRSMLRRAADLVEMREAERCCGGAGAFSLFHYDLSMQIADHKVNAIRESGADTVATGCPGCMLQIADRTADAGLNVRVVHPIQILDEALAQARS